MPDWDENSPELKSNLAAAARMARDSARDLQTPTLDLAKKWQARIMQGLRPKDGADPSWYGKFRGEKGQETIGVKIHGREGTLPDLLDHELRHFEQTLQQAIDILDQQLLVPDQDAKVVALDESGLRSVLGLMAWVHGEWVRMHPFANGNGRLVSGPIGLPCAMDCPRSFACVLGLAAWPMQMLPFNRWMAIGKP